MKIERFEMSDYKIYNPVTNDVILDYELHQDSLSLIAYWIDEVFEEPYFNSDVLETAWKEFLEKFENENEEIDPDFDDLEKFLLEYDNPNWKVIEITSWDIACGPVSNTVWHVVDKDTVVEKINEDEKSNN